MLAAMDVTLTKAKRRLQEAEASFERDKHGKNAFIGSSAWGNYAYARKELEDARAEVAVHD
jgi:hypothetical protein